MTIFYFTSTGNSLAVAKKFGAKLVSIPQVIGGETLDFNDDAIGIIFPIYGFYCPKMVRRFIARAKLSADYIFAVGTYGNLPGACMCNLQKNAAKNGIKIDYAASLLMVDNYLPGFEIGDQIAKIPQKKTDENLAKIIADVSNRAALNAAASPLWIAATAAIQAGENAFMSAASARSYAVNSSCTKCGTCAKVCPSGNIKVGENVEFSDKCEWCLGCVHLCPKNAIHLKNEKSSVRWRHPDVSLAEIIKSNDRSVAK